MTPVTLRSDFDAAQLRALATVSKSAGATRRLLALAEIYDGGSRTDAAGVGLQTVRDWVMRFNARGPAGLVDGKAKGQTPKLSDEHRRALIAIIEAGPIPAVHGVVRWRLCDLSLWLYEEHGVSASKQVLSRELRKLGYRKLSARPRHHEKSEAAAEAFKKTFPRSWRTLRPKSAATPVASP